MSFNERLKTIRKERNLTQKMVASKLNVVESCYANYEQGRTEPSVETIINLCKIFDISSDYLLGLENEYGKSIDVS